MLWHIFRANLANTWTVFNDLSLRFKQSIKQSKQGYWAKPNQKKIRRSPREKCLGTYRNDSRVRVLGVLGNKGKIKEKYRMEQACMNLFQGMGPGTSKCWFWWSREVVSIYVSREQVRKNCGNIGKKGILEENSPPPLSGRPWNDLKKISLGTCQKLAGWEGGGI